MKKHLPLLITALAALGVALTFRSSQRVGDFDAQGFGSLPVLVNGRIKPLDTVARTSLLMMQGRQRVTTTDGRSLTPSEWLLDMLYHGHAADHYPVFEITHPDLLALVGVRTEEGAGGKRFSLQQLRGRIADLDRQARLADNTESPLRTPFQRAVVQLRDRLALYQRLQSSLVGFGDEGFLAQLARFEQVLPGVQAGHSAPGASAHAGEDAKLVLEMGRTFASMDAYAYFRPIPPAAGEPVTAWKTAGAAWSDTLSGAKPAPAATLYASLGRAWRSRDAASFNRILADYRQTLAALLPEVMRKSTVELRFNVAQPFYTSTLLYVAVFLLAVLSWLRWPDVARRSAFGLLCIAFALTTAGIATRMWLEARPPVTNLYSSALFVGWGAVALCLLLERLHRNAIGSVAAGIVGFATLVIAHHLSLGGDTMEMMRAVLDSNFWLATHVITIAVGYSAAFLAGFLALIYVLRGVLTRSLDRATGDALGRMIYGIICFATLFSFVGTILGGIWADQSWGRFWGWDPKENGALMIVIWCAIILHVRWAGLVRTRGLAVLAIFGNVITAWSWFGVNMLGVGLHSYGFMDSAFWWLVAFAVSQVGVMLLAAMPPTRWRSRTALA